MTAEEPIFLDSLWASASFASDKPTSLGFAPFSQVLPGNTLLVAASFGVLLSAGFARPIAPQRLTANMATVSRLMKTRWEERSMLFLIAVIGCPRHQSIYWGDPS